MTAISAVPNGLTRKAKPWGAGALLHRDGELLAVVDQLANEVEDATKAAGRAPWLGWGVGGRRT
jgi:hypothetical protein